tara:strand:- start:5635 stop:5979 length:345 start_codon:yes stop_codon:yes gene_type:complete
MDRRTLMTKETLAQEAASTVTNRYLPQLEAIEKQHDDLLTSLKEELSLDEETYAKLENFVVAVGLSTRDLIEPLWQDVCIAEEEALSDKRKLVKSKIAIAGLKTAIGNFEAIVK